MDWRNRIGLYGAYFLGLSGIGFTLPYLPLYLRQQGMSDRTIGIISTLAALAGLAQFLIGVWSDRIKRRKPFLVVLLAVLAVSTWLLQGGGIGGVVWLAFLVILFAENGVCRATAESLFGAEVAELAAPDQVGASLGALRFWKPLGVIAVALMGSVLAEHLGVASILLPLAAVQALAVVAALLIHEGQAKPAAMLLPPRPSQNGDPTGEAGLGLKDRTLWVFVAAMILFHMANAPGGVYLGLFLKTDLHSSDGLLSYAFIISMVAWMLVVRPAGRLADRKGRKPLLIAGWATMTLRLILVAVAEAPWQILAIQILDGFAQGLFIVVASAWMTDWLADHKRVGEAQVLVGSALVAGSAIGPSLSGLVVEGLGYRGMFWLMAGIGTVATLIVVVFVPESLKAGSAYPGVAPLTELDQDEGPPAPNIRAVFRGRCGPHPPDRPT
jgi:MFS family permease